jgi:hypothetical protein
VGFGVDFFGRGWWETETGGADAGGAAGERRAERRAKAAAATDRADDGIAAVRCDGWIGRRRCVFELVGRGDAGFVKAREFVDVAVVRESNVVREW